MGKALYVQLFLLMLVLAYVPMAAGQKQSADHAQCYDNSIQVPCPFPADYFRGLDFSTRGCGDYSYTRLGHGGQELHKNAKHRDYGGAWFMTRDNLTGLVWEIKTLENMKDLYNFKDALTYAENLELGGYSDWRLPTAGELFSLVNLCSFAPAIDEEWFPNTLPENYWTSSTAPDDPEGIWRVRFGSGMVLFTYNRSAAYHVRVVRSE